MNMQSHTITSSLSSLSKKQEPSSRDQATSAVTPAASKSERKLSVSFKSTVVMHKVLHVRDMSDEEIDSIWYNGEDIRNIKRECALTIHMMMTQKPMIDTTSYCSRGLECRTPKRSQRLQKRRYDAIDSVLDEQDRAWTLYNNGFKSALNESEKTIALVYQRHSVDAQMAANKQGLIDQHDCQSCSPMQLNSKKLNVLSGNAAPPAIPVRQPSHPVSTLDTAKASHPNRAKKSMMSAAA